MRLTGHILRKDIRRWWPAVAATWAMLVMLAGVDAKRADWIASPMEGWLNLLLIMGWGMLAALAVLEEPLVGERNFWTTRPYRWPALLASKLIFVILAIQLPLLLAGLFVLMRHGFLPAGDLGPLFRKQILLFGVVTLPAMALASLVRNFTQFVIAVFAVAAMVAFLNDGFQSFPNLRNQEAQVRDAAIEILIIIGSLAAIWIQYAWRRAIPARAIAIAAALGAASIFAWLPAHAEYALNRSESLETPRITLRNARTAVSSALARVRGTQPVVVLPIEVSSNAQTDAFKVPMVEVEISTQDGMHLRSIPRTHNRPFEKIDLMAYLFSTPQEQARSLSGTNTPDWLALHFSGPAWERLKNSRVRIRGTAAIDFFRRGEPVVLPRQGSANVPDLGRCAAMTTDDPYSEKMLKILCESPRDLPAATITLTHEASGREWRAGLSSAVTYTAGPHAAWLSALNRGQSFFHLTNSVENAPGAQWLVPVSYLPSIRVEITPQIRTGHTLAHFDLGEIDLSTWGGR